MHVAQTRTVSQAKGAAVTTLTEPEWGGDIIRQDTTPNNIKRGKKWNPLLIGEKCLSLTLNIFFSQ